MSGWDHEYDFDDEIARDQFIEETIRGISEDGVRNYLGTYGDAVDERISNSLAQACQLRDFGWCPSSVVMSVTAIELTIRFLLVRPLIQAAFLSEDWADLLTRRITSGRTAEDRELLPTVLAFHDIDIKQIRLSDGRELWATLLRIYKVRDKAVHAGQPATFEDAETAIDCTTTLRKSVVVPLAEKHGFTLEATGCWHNVEKLGASRAIYSVRSPFK
jgi:hypothetical protein